MMGSPQLRTLAQHTGRAQPRIWTRLPCASLPEAPPPPPFPLFLQHHHHTHHHTFTTNTHHTSPAIALSFAPDLVVDHQTEPLERGREGESSPVRSRGFWPFKGATSTAPAGAGRRNQTVCGVPVGPGPGPGHPEPPQTVCPGRRRAKRQGETSPHLKLTWAVGSRSLENPLDLTSGLSRI